VHCRLQFLVRDYQNYDESVEEDTPEEEKVPHGLKLAQSFVFHEFCIFVDTHCRIG
jgi:hypothetical protein